MTGRVKNYWEKEKEKHQNTKSNTEMTQLQGLMIKSWRVIDLKIKTRKDGSWSATFLCECIIKLMRWLLYSHIYICRKYIFKNDRAFPCFVFFCCSSTLQTGDGTVRLQGGAGETHAECSKVQSSQGCTCTPRRRHCTGLRCDSYTNWDNRGPSAQRDRLCQRVQRHS